MTVRDLIKAALRLLRVVAAGEEPAASEMRDALEALNLLLANMKAQGADLGFAPVDLNDDVPLPPEHVRCVKYLLAMEVSPEYSAEVSPEVAVQASESLKQLQAAYREIPTLSADAALWQRSVAFDVNRG